MLKNLFTLLCGIVVLASLSGCVNKSSAQLTPGTDLTTLKKFYIIHEEGDKEIDGHIRKNLRAKRLFRRDRTCVDNSVQGRCRGHLHGQMDVGHNHVPAGTEHRTAKPKDNFPLASGNALHSSLTRKSAPDMVDEVLTSIFNSASTQGDGKK